MRLPFFLLFCFTFGQESIDLPPAAVWPMPSYQHLGDINLAFDPSSFSFQTASTSTILASGIDRYKTILASSMGVRPLGC